MLVLSGTAEDEDEDADGRDDAVESFGFVWSDVAED